MKKLTCTLAFDKETSNRRGSPVYRSVEGYDSSTLANRFYEKLYEHFRAHQPSLLSAYTMDVEVYQGKAHVTLMDQQTRRALSQATWTIDVQNGELVFVRSMPQDAITSMPEIPVMSLSVSTRKCKACGKLINNERESALDKGILLCENCSRMYNHSSDAFTWKYQRVGRMVTSSFGFELELCLREGYTSRNTAKTARYTNLLHRLILAGFLRTGDGTVDDEMKSPIFCTGYVPGNLKKVLSLASEFTQHPNVGTHVHVYYPAGISREGRTRLYDCLYLLEEYLTTHNESTQAIWGRSFTYYAHFPMNQAHGSWVQLRDHTIEWRLCKLRSYQQFSKLVKFVVQATEKIKHSQNNAVTAEDILSLYVSTFGLSQETPDTSMYAAYQAQGYTMDYEPYGGTRNYPEIFSRPYYFSHDEDNDCDEDDVSVYDDDNEGDSF